MIIEFSLNKLWGSRIIAWYTRGHFGHCSIVKDTNTLISARMFHGVIEHPRDTSKYMDWEYWHIKDADGKGMESVLKKIGKGYDWLAVISYLTRRNMHNPDAFSCSELGRIALLETSNYLYGSIPHLATPEKFPPMMLRCILADLACLKQPFVKYLGKKIPPEAWY
jgi:hypothetical protein